MTALVAELEKAKEALRFYANPEVYEQYEADGHSKYEDDGGEYASKVLEELAK